MQVNWDVDDFQPSKATVITLGTFDGVHQGHGRIIEKLNQAAQERDALSVLMTFEPHPQMVLDSQRQPSVQLLTCIEEKIRLLQDRNLHHLVVAQFTSQFAAIEPEDFVTNILCRKMRMQHIVIGHDHAFGKKRRGNLQLLLDLSVKNHFTVETIEAVQNQGDTISSTQIRQALHAGDLAKANRLLGRCYSLSGQVIKGDQRGRSLGFPTANIRPCSRQKLIPRSGVYASRLAVKGQIYSSATYIGTKPTFGINEPSIEVHIIGQNIELYQEHAELQLCRWMREDRSFGDKRSLIEQIETDIKSIQHILNQ